MFRQTIAAAGLAALLSMTPAQAQDATDYLDLPGPITVGGTDYSLAWSSNPQPGYFKQEYVPQGDSVENFKTMVLVEFLASGLELTEVVSAQMEMIKQRKASDPIANMAVFSNPDTGEMVLDFVLSAKDEAGEYIIEWNGYRYAEAERDGERGTLLFAISERAYGNAASEAFLRGLGDFKTQRILDLTKAELPEIK